MGKYIIDTDQYTHMFNPSCIGIYGIGKNIDADDDEDVVWSRMVNIDYLDKLDSKYIEENFDGLFDGEHQKGFDEGEKHGQEETWWAVKKIYGVPDNGALTSIEVSELFGGSDDWLGFDYCIIPEEYTAQEAIGKIKAYEQKRDKRDIESDLDYLMRSTGMTVDEIAQRLNEIGE